MKLAQIATAALLLAGAAGDAAAQQKTLKDRLPAPGTSSSPR